ncbi:MAG: hypothetical protein IME96_05630 [Proteobacteria bacterium]|nr:hypothetical protein [Pseudomonadota bacterium]
MMMKIMLRIFLIIALLSPSLLWAEEATDSRKEIEELKSRLEVVEATKEKEIEELKSRLEVVEATNEDVEDRLSRLFTLSGYADSEYIIDDRGGKSDGFKIHHLSLFFKKKISDKWKLFSELEYEYAPKFESGVAQGKIFVEVFTIDYNYNHYINIRAGRYLTPVGIWNVEHYPPFVSTQERPQHIRKIFPQISDGLQFFGTVNLGKIVTDYIAFISNGSDDLVNGISDSGSGDDNDNKAVGGRLKFKFPLLSTTELGISGYREKDNFDAEVNASGLDLSLQWKRLKFQAEYAAGSYDVATGTDYDRKGYYGQLSYGIADLDLIYRYDWYDADDTVAKGDKTINSVALNYHFTPSVVGKVEHHVNDYEDSAKEDYDKTVFSIAVYLGD